MSALQFFHLAKVIGCMGICIGAFRSVALPQMQYPYHVPPTERTVKINIERLPLGNYGYPESARIERLREEYSKKKSSEFISRPDSEQSCRSELHKGYTCHEIENAQVGYSHSFPQSVGMHGDGFFFAIDFQSREIQVFHDTARGQFYVRPTKRNDQVFGPFKGEPISELKRAEFPVKARDGFPGVTLKYLSKRWEYPKEEDAIIDRRGPGYDHAGGMPSGREVEAGRLQAQFFRFRLENKSGTNLYLLYDNDEPEAFALTRHTTWTAWSRNSQSKFNSEQVYNSGQRLNWVSLPKGSALEFETRAGCGLDWTCALGIYLNDERSFWNDVQMIAVFPGNKPRTFSRRNAPPKR